MAHDILLSKIDQPLARLRRRAGVFFFWSCDSIDGSRVVGEKTVSDLWTGRFLESFIILY